MDAAAGGSFRIAAVQATPVLLDREAGVDKACRLIAEAGREGSSLAVFPEAFIPGYPFWVWLVPPGDTHPLRALYARLLASSVTVEDEATRRLCAAARDAGVAVVMGVSEVNAEASRSSLYNTVLYIAADGRLLGKHRKLVPTAGERLVWAQGDGSDLAVHELPFGRLSGLICWESYMPLARAALWSWGTQLYAAPTWDRGEPWISTMRHCAKEGRSFVVGTGSTLHVDDVPAALGLGDGYLAGKGPWINTGGSLIVDPDGKIVAGPVFEKETILYADVRPEQLTGPRWQLDVAGHYARPDVFELRVRRRPRPMLVVDDTDEAP
jgi:nitrilase